MMVVVAWLVGPVYDAARIIPTSRITLEGICIHRSIWPSNFWNSFTGVITYSVAFLKHPLL